MPTRPPYTSSARRRKSFNVRGTFMAAQYVASVRKVGRASLFEFEQVSVRFGVTAVLDAVDVALPDEGITVLAGPSGAGKSTMLRLCNRLIVPTAGHVRFRGADLGSVDPLSLRRRVGMVFQRPTLF